MNFVKVGKRFINLDNVAEVDAMSPSQLAYHKSESNPKWSGCYVTYTAFQEATEKLFNEDADAMMTHLGSVAMDLTPAAPDDREYADFRKRGGLMDRRAWDGKRATLKDYLAMPADTSGTRAATISRLESDLLL